MKSLASKLPFLVIAVAVILTAVLFLKTFDGSPAPKEGLTTEAAAVATGQPARAEGSVPVDRGGAAPREDALAGAAVSVSIRVVDVKGNSLDGAIVLPLASNATVEQSGGAFVVTGLLPFTVNAFAAGYAGSATRGFDAKPPSEVTIRLTREITIPVKVFSEDGSSPGPLTGYFYFLCGDGRGYTRVELDSRGECAAVALPEGRALLGFASDRLEGLAVERETQEKTLLSVAVRPRLAGTLRVKTRDADLMPPTVTFPLLPAEFSRGNALAPHALRQASREEEGWRVFENVGAGSAQVIARDGMESKVAHGFAVVAPGKTTDFILE